MHQTQPEVYLISSPVIEHSNLADYLKEVHGLAWLEETNIEELLPEIAGRLCYRSWAPGLNPNVTKVRTDHAAYLANIIESEHGSVLEHVQLSFIFHNVSRVFTHELVRHRVGVAISQESLRYVRLTDIGFRIPEVLKPIEDKVIGLLEQIERFQYEAAEFFELDDPKTNFARKKEITSALRRLAPLGLSTGLMWSANIRTLRFVLGKRTHHTAEEEMRLVFDQVGEIVSSKYPLLFQDFSRNDAGEWISPHSKA